MASSAPPNTEHNELGFAAYSNYSRKCTKGNQFASQTERTSKNSPCNIQLHEHAASVSHCQSPAGVRVQPSPLVHLPRLANVLRNGLHQPDELVPLLLGQVRDESRSADHATLPAGQPGLPFNGILEKHFFQKRCQ